MIPTNETIIGLLAALESLIAQHHILDCDDVLITARDGLLFLQVDDTDFTRLLCADFAAWAVETEAIWEVCA